MIEALGSCDNECVVGFGNNDNFIVWLFGCQKMVSRINDKCI